MLPEQDRAARVLQKEVGCDRRGRRTMEAGRQEDEGGRPSPRAPPVPRRGKSCAKGRRVPARTSRTSPSACRAVRRRGGQPARRTGGRPQPPACVWRSYGRHWRTSSSGRAASVTASVPACGPGSPRAKRSGRSGYIRRSSTPAGRRYVPADGRAADRPASRGSVQQREAARILASSGRGVRPPPTPGRGAR